MEATLGLQEQVERNMEQIGEEILPITMAVGQNGLLILV